MHNQNIRHVCSLTINDTLLYYTWVHMFCPLGSNFAQLLHDDIFMLWCTKSHVTINWSRFIMQHTIKFRDNNMPILYAGLKINVFNISFTAFQIILKNTFTIFNISIQFITEKCIFMKTFHIMIMITNSYFFSKIIIQRYWK